MWLPMIRFKAMAQHWIKKCAGRVVSQLGVVLLRMGDVVINTEPCNRELRSGNDSRFLQMVQGVMRGKNSEQLVKNTARSGMTFAGNRWFKALLVGITLLMVAQGGTAYSVGRIERQNGIPSNQYQNTTYHPEPHVLLKKEKSTGDYKGFIQDSVYQLSRDYLLLLVYRASCPYCRRFTPIIQSFSDQAGIKIVGVPTTADQLAEFHDSYPLTPQLKSILFGHNQHVAIPALFLIYKPKHRVFPVSQGYLSFQQLTQRMNALSKVVIQFNKGRDYVYH